MPKTYAAHLGVGAHAVAQALSIPATAGRGIDFQGADPTRIAAATGLDSALIKAMLLAPAPAAMPLAAWAPQPESRFCPACLAKGTGWPPRWSRATTFLCPRHRVLLAEACALCGAKPATPSPFAPPSAARGCGHDLTLIIEHPTLGSAAKTLGITHTPLARQLGRLERDCGGQLFHRESPRAPLGPLTELAQQLREQITAHRPPARYHT